MTSLHKSSKNHPNTRIFHSLKVASIWSLKVGALWATTLAFGVGIHVAHAQSWTSSATPSSPDSLFEMLALGVLFIVFVLLCMSHRNTRNTPPFSDDDTL